MRKKLLLILFLLLLLSPLLANNPSIVKVELSPSHQVDLLEVYTTGNISPQGLLSDNQLTIDLPNTQVSDNIKVVRRNSTRIGKLSIREISSQNSRLTITLKKDVDYEIINIFGRNKSIIEVYDRSDFAKDLMAAWERKNLKAKGQKLKPVKYKQLLSRSRQQVEGKIFGGEPGHGGSDPGAFSANKIPEKTLTLQTARQIGLLLQQAGATVYLTRNEDRSSNLKDIVDFTNKIKADIFISIHYNFAYNRDVSGTETYYYNSDSQRLAQNIQKNLVLGLGRKDRGVRRGMFYTIHHTNMPAVLIEPAYISNWQEGDLAGSASFQNKIAAAMAKGVISYFRNTHD